MPSLQKKSVHIIGLITISLTSLTFMHYNMVKYAEVPFDPTSYIDNFTGCGFDLIVFFCVSMLVFRNNVMHSIMACCVTAILWSFANVLYSRFFFQHITLSAIGQTGNLSDLFVIKSIIGGLHWSDLLFVFLLLTALWIYNTADKTIRITLKQASIYILTVLSVLVFLSFSSTIVYSCTKSEFRSFGFIRHHLYTHHFDLYRNSANPNWTHFQRGSVRTLFHPLFHDMFTSQKLTREQIATIKQETDNQTDKTTLHEKPPVCNVIFIIVESYLSATSDLIIGGKEITPYLNQLKKSDNVYYNGHLKSNITIGESGDGQFICMTGLLPLRSEVTVGRAKNCTLPGLPKVLSKVMHLDTKMLIPTTPSMWEQEKMCQKYGIDKLYSCTDVNPSGGDLNDQQIFHALSQFDKQCQHPFFTLVLTMSMHQPYNAPVDPYFTFRAPSDYSEEYVNYLNACHYTDKQIGTYLKHLKDIGLYQKSLIIITADHHPNPNSIKMDHLSSDIPLYIVNGNIDNNSAWAGPCNQLDIYTTILDILVKEKAEWRGLGRTLLSPQYTNSINPQYWDISEWIIRGNYFDMK